MAQEAFAFFHLVCFYVSSTRDSLYQPFLTICLLIAAVCRPLPVTFHRGESAGSLALPGKGGAGRELSIRFFGGGPSLLYSVQSRLWLCCFPSRGKVQAWGLCHCSVGRGSIGGAEHGGPAASARGMLLLYL